MDEAYGQFADWSALSLVDDEVPLVVTRTFSKTWSMAAARLGYLVGPAAVVADLERVALPVPPRRPEAGGRPAGRPLRRGNGGAGGLIVRERHRLLAALGRLPVTAWPSQANFILFRPEHRKGAEVWQGLLDRSVLVRDTSSWPRLADCLRVTVGTPAENDAFLAALGRGAGVTRLAVRRAAAGDQGDDDRGPPGPRRHRAGVGVDRAARSSTTWWPSSASTPASTSTVHAAGDLEVDAHHTVEDVGILLGECLRDALGDKAGVRRFASIDVPLDEALISVALDLSGRPFLVYQVDPGAGGEAYPLGSPPFDPQLAEEFWRALVTSAGITLHLRMVSGPQHPPHPGGVLQGRGPGLARRRAGRGRRGAVDEGDLLRSA